MDGIQEGPGEGLSVDLREYLANCQMTQLEEFGLSLDCFQQRGELLTWTHDMFRWWKEHCEDLLNPTGTSSTEGSLVHPSGRGHRGS